MMRAILLGGVLCIGSAAGAQAPAPEMSGPEILKKSAATYAALDFYEARQPRLGSATSVRASWR
jgi:hypothetical protein